MSLTRQRIEQIEKAAFKKILKSKYAVSLVEFMQNPDRALKCIEEKRRPKCKKNLIK